MDFAILTNVLTQAWSGMTTGQYKKFKGLTKENLRDNMTNIELALNTLAEVATTEYSRQSNPQTMEKRLGRSVITKERASDYILPEQPKKEVEELPFEDVP